MSPLRQLTLSTFASAGIILITAARAASHEPPIVVTGDAGHNHELVRQTVNIADLDMATATGQAEAEKRISRAITMVCPAAAGNMPRYQRDHAVSCQKSARAQGKTQLDHAVAHAKTMHGKK
jgi:UrcA family protein